jgi:hypothetical protein
MLQAHLHQNTITSTSNQRSSSTFRASATRTSASSIPVYTTKWSHIGCFSNPSDDEVSLLFKSEKMNSELCIFAASARKTTTPTTTYHYVGLDHGRDCCAATAAPSPIPKSLIEATACTNPFLGKTAGGPVEMCGGWKQYHLYASMTGSVFSEPVATSILA